MSTRASEVPEAAVYSVVYYANRGESAWWARFTHREFTHVEVWWDLGEDYWVALRPNYCFVTCDIMRGAPVAGTNEISQVQRVECGRSATRPMFPLGMKTCVTFVKAVLGVRAAWVVTPRQLFSYISRREKLA